MMRRMLRIALISAPALIAAQGGDPETFSTPDEARDALVRAVNIGVEAIITLFGPGSAEVLRTADPVMDKNVLERFKRRAGEKTQLELDEMNPDRIILLIGSEEVPFAVPMVRKHGRWYFDIQEGKAEIRNRAIGGNELDAIEICRGYVEARSSNTSIFPYHIAQQLVERCLHPARDEEVHMSSVRVDFNDRFPGVKLDPLSRVRDRRQRILAESFCPFEPMKVHMKSLACRRNWFFIAATHLVLLEAHAASGPAVVSEMVEERLRCAATSARRPANALPMITRVALRSIARLIS